MDKTLIGFDFAMLLVGLAAFTGIVWGIDKLLFEKKRRQLGEFAREPTLVEYCRSFFPVIFVVLLLRSFVAEPFRIPSGSMMPTLLIGDFILVDKFSYGVRLPVLNTKIIELGKPVRGDVVVFKYPGRGPTDSKRGEDYIKRVIGIPGDTIEYKDKTLYVNGEVIPQIDPDVYVGTNSGANMTGTEKRTELANGISHDILIDPRAWSTMNAGPFTVGENEYFVMGDNRDHSDDGRFWGMVPEANLVGRAFFVWMNWDFKSGGGDFSRIGTVVKGGES